jgi:hypothetical protein
MLLLGHPHKPQYFSISGSPNQAEISHIPQTAQFGDFPLSIGCESHFFNHGLPLELCPIALW